MVYLTKNDFNIHMLRHNKKIINCKITDNITIKIISKQYKIDEESINNLLIKNNGIELYNIMLNINDLNNLINDNTKTFFKLKYNINIDYFQQTNNVAWIIFDGFLHVKDYFFKNNINIKIIREIYNIFNSLNKNIVKSNNIIFFNNINDEYNFIDEITKIIGDYYGDY